MDGIKRKLVWGHDVDGGVQEEGDAGPCVDAALGGGRACPHPALNVKDVLSRLDLLGTYDLKGDTIFTHAKNQSSPDTSAYAQPSSVPFAWLSAQPRNSSLNLYDGEETRVTDEWNLQKSISNDTHRPPSQADSSGCQPQRTACASSSDFDEQADDSGMSIVRWFKNTAGSPDWLQATLVGSVDGTRGRLPLFGGADSPSRDGTPLLAKLKEKGPPKTLCKNLPKRDAGEQTPFGRDRPKLLHTPDAIAMRKAIEAEIILEPVSTYRSSADSLRSPPAVLSHRNSGSWSVRGSNSARSSSEGRESSPGGYSTSRSARLSAGGRSHHDSMHTGRLSLPTRPELPGLCDASSEQDPAHYDAIQADVDVDGIQRQVSRLSQHLISTGQLTQAQRKSFSGKPALAGASERRFSITEPVALCRDVGAREKRASWNWREDVNKKISGLFRHSNPILDIVQSARVDSKTRKASL